MRTVPLLVETRLEQQASSYLEDAVATAASSDLAEVRAVHCACGRAEVSQIEDVGGFAAELESEAFVDREVAEE